MVQDNSDPSVKKAVKREVENLPGRDEDTTMPSSSSCLAIFKERDSCPEAASTLKQSELKEGKVVSSIVMQTMLGDVIFLKNGGYNIQREHQHQCKSS
jgi:hypothetical protein